MRREKTHMNRQFLLGITITVAATCAGCAREDPEAGIDEAYRSQVDKAEAVEQQLQDSVDERLKQIDSEQ
jgi:hypothetical protein